MPLDDIVRDLEKRAARAQRAAVGARSPSLRRYQSGRADGLDLAAQIVRETLGAIAGGSKMAGGTAAASPRAASPEVPA